ncbi:MAG: hypothetical protein ACTSV5_10225 [Promethearchaeota archaeon]
MKFNVGDKVIYNFDNDQLYKLDKVATKKLKNTIGVITHVNVDLGYPYQVKWEGYDFINSSVEVLNDSELIDAKGIAFNKWLKETLGEDNDSTKTD